MKSALMASMYMGISPGNVGTMNYLDAYRRESQRDFGDGALLHRLVIRHRVRVAWLVDGRDDGRRLRCAGR